VRAGASSPPRPLPFRGGGSLLAVRGEGPGALGEALLQRRDVLRREVAHAVGELLRDVDVELVIGGQLEERVVPARETEPREVRDELVERQALEAQRREPVDHVEHGARGVEQIDRDVDRLARHRGDELEAQTMLARSFVSPEARSTASSTTRPSPAA
jgi:hypothetical protein